ncbi:VWA domain-containing protein [Candidatus Kuenenbacteria bacterium]|nr:VWA domain-containing protein [Candidatus Kuenenbacteria bacterium]
MKKIIKRLSVLNVLILFVELIFSSLVFVSPATDTGATDDKLCSQPVDVVMILDRSGSMDYTSRCDWWQYVCVDKPLCKKWEWQQKTDYNVSQEWCASKMQSAPHQSVYLAIDPKKIDAAKEAANDFLALMGASDQSALISYANTATLDKVLSFDHLATETAINSLVASGATNIGDALKLGIQELKSARANAQANHVMILLTDGKANKPSGPGYGEYAADVTYAENQASAAAALGFKIFTIGLGENGEINETMLQNIAAATGASYYHSPSQTDLEAIYQDISSKVCQYGSISGCLYNDQNNNGVIDPGEPTLSAWEVTLNNNDERTQQTDAAGCYTFAGLEDGAYTISETVKSGWQQTYPANNQNQPVTITNHNDIANIDFANYEIPPACGDGNLNNDEQCDDGNNQNGDGCSAVCQLEPTCTDADADGYFAEGGACGLADCDDTNSAINPSTTEICDLLDNNCDGQTDETFSDLGSSCSDGIGMCLMTGTKICSTDGTGTVCSATAGDPAAEVCDGTLDENCDGTVDENCACTDGATQACGPTAEIGVCKFGVQTCAAGAWSACLGSVMPTDETCDGLDNDCDGENDETFLNLNNSCTVGIGKCQVSGQYICSANFSDTTCNVSPGTPDAEETCDNSLDDDCDGQIDEDCSAAPYCGDNIKNGADECDGTDGVGVHQACSETCTLISLPYCGDGLVNNTEQCDGTAGITTGYHCTSSCLLEADQTGPTTGSLSGYVFEDLDGATTTTSDLIGLSGWLINLFNSASSTLPIATTTTDAAGYFEFKNLLPDSYNLTEILQTDWQQISAPSTPLIITAGLDLLNNNFINYSSGGSGGDEPYCGDGQKNNNEECDGTDGLLPDHTCNQSCVLVKNSSGGGSGGGGGVGYVCGNGIREGSEVCDQFSSVPSGYICNAFCTAYDPAGSGGATNSTSTAPTDQNSNPSANQTKPDKKTDRPTNLAPKTDTDHSPIALGSATPAATTDGSKEDSGNIQSAPSLGASAPTILGAGADLCTHCPWWIWPLLAILHLAILIIYLLIVSPSEKNTPSDSSKSDHQNDSFIKGSWWWLAPVFVLLAVIFYLLVFVCEIPYLTPAIILSSFFLMLISHYSLLRSTHGSLAKIATIVFLTIAPIAAYLYCPWDQTWFWLAVILPYALALFCFILSTVKLAKYRSLWGWFILIASILMVVLEWLIEHCQC